MRAVRCGHCGLLVGLGDFGPEAVFATVRLHFPRTVDGETAVPALGPRSKSVGMMVCRGCGVLGKVANATDQQPGH